MSEASYAEGAPAENQEEGYAHCAQMFWSMRNQATVEEVDKATSIMDIRIVCELLGKLPHPRDQDSIKTIAASVLGLRVDPPQKETDISNCVAPSPGDNKRKCSESPDPEMPDPKTQRKPSLICNHCGDGVDNGSRCDECAHSECIPCGCTGLRNTLDGHNKFIESGGILACSIPGCTGRMQPLDKNVSLYAASVATAEMLKTRNDSTVPEMMKMASKIFLTGAIADHTDQEVVSQAMFILATAMNEMNGHGKQPATAGSQIELPQLLLELVASLTNIKCPSCNTLAEHRDNCGSVNCPGCGKDLCAFCSRLDCGGCTKTIFAFDESNEPQQKKLLGSCYDEWYESSGDVTIGKVLFQVLARSRSHVGLYLLMQALLEFLGATPDEQKAVNTLLQIHTETQYSCGRFNLVQQDDGKYTLVSSASGQFPQELDVPELFSIFWPVRSDHEYLNSTLAERRFRDAVDRLTMNLDSLISLSEFLQDNIPEECSALIQTIRGKLSGSMFTSGQHLREMREYLYTAITRHGIVLVKNVSQHQPVRESTGRTPHTEAEVDRVKEVLLRCLHTPLTVAVLRPILNSCYATVNAAVNAIRAEQPNGEMLSVKPRNAGSPREMVIAYGPYRPSDNDFRFPANFAQPSRKGKDDGLADEDARAAVTMAGSLGVCCIERIVFCNGLRNSLRTDHLVGWSRDNFRNKNELASHILEHPELRELYNNDVVNRVLAWARRVLPTPGQNTTSMNAPTITDAN